MMTAMLLQRVHHTIASSPDGNRTHIASFVGWSPEAIRPRGRLFTEDIQLLGSVKTYSNGQQCGPTLHQQFQYVLQSILLQHCPFF